MKNIFRLLLILVLVSATPVFASTRLFQAGDNLSVNEELDGSSFVAGNSVSTTNKVNGILFLAGNDVNVKSSSDYAFIAGNIVNIEEANFKDGFVAGNVVTLKNVDIERDLYVAGTKVTINTNIGRKLTAFGEDVVIDGTIDGDVYIGASNITINSNTVINGTLTYNDDAKTIISKDAVINNTKIEKHTANYSKVFVSKLIDKIFSFVNSLVLALLLALIVPKLYEKIISQGKNMILNNIGFGLLSLLFVPLAALIIIATVCGVYLGLLILCLYVISILLSTILSSYFYGNLLLGSKIKNKYLLITLTLLIIYLLRLIPFVGGIVSIVTICTGLGIVLNLFLKRK